MKDFEKIEHLLLSKRFEELSPTEVKEVTGYFENATDYNDMRDTLMQVKSTLAADKLLIKPNVELKEKLLQKFENTHTQPSSASFGKRKPFFRSVAFQWSAAASVVILLSVSFFWYIQNMKSKGNDNMAVNYETPASKDVLLEENTISTDSVQSELSKSKVVTLDPKYGNTFINDDEVNQPTNVGGFNLESEVGEGQINNRSQENKNMYGTFGTVSQDNTTLPVINTVGTETDSKEEQIDTKNYYFNGVINSNTDKKDDDILKGDYEDKLNDDKVMDPNKSIPVQTQSIFNYSVNKNETTTDREFWKRNKNKKENNKNVSQVSLGLAQEKYAENLDSTKLRLDSLQIDPNIQIDQKDLDKNNK